MTAKQQNSAFRPEIEGLRAVAATLVAVFHIWLGRVSGGVDVFFVVSSFLITTGLISQIERTGTVDFARFWGRLIRRLIPAALLVLLVVIVASVLWLPKSRWKDTAEGIAAAAVYLENWKLAHDAVDYLQQNSPPSPVTHYWALSVQGQFYLVWPFLFFFTALAARRANVAFRKAIVPVLAVVLAISLAYSIYLTRVNQPVAYFNTFARIWEFCLGALLAVFIPRLNWPNPVRLVAGWTGLIAIVSCGIIFQVSRVFPGYMALWPTVAGSLVIIAGTTRGGFGADRFLASKPMVYLGSISYGIYLWHYPILAFCKAYADPFPVSNLAGVCILIAAVGLAALTKRFVEDNIRTSSSGKEKAWRAYAVGAAWAFPVVVALGAWTQYYRHLRAHARGPNVTARASHPGAHAMERGFKEPEEYPANIYPGPLVVYEDRESFDDPRCRPRETTVPDECILGAKDGKFVLAVVGGSHSSQWLPALQNIATREHWKIVFFARSNCPFHLGEARVSDGEIDDCVEWNQNVLKEVLKIKPDALFMTSTREQDGDEFVPEGYVAAWRALEKGNVRVVAIRDNPKVKFDAPECVELHGADSDQCALVRAKVLEVPSPTETVQNLPTNVRFIDLSDYFCDATTCPPVIGNVMVYRHLSHITATYVLTLEPMLSKELHRVLELDAQPGQAKAEAYTQTSPD